MLKSCKYCGKIHDEKVICEQKQQVLEKQKDRKYHHTETYKAYHNSTYWNKLSKHIRERDLYMCQICGKQAEEVHHIEKIEEEPNKAYDETNLISLCHLCHTRAEKGFIEKSELLNLVEQSIKK